MKLQVNQCTRQMVKMTRSLRRFLKLEELFALKPSPRVLQMVRSWVRNINLCRPA